VPTGSRSRQAGRGSASSAVRPPDGAARESRRRGIRKTYKLFIGGRFPRSESGRSYRIARADGTVVNASHGSRKDLRDAVRAARSAVPAWSGLTAYNRGQILYRIAEVLESRRGELADELRAGGGDSGTPRSDRAARREVEATIDRWVWYAGWADKFATLLGGVNPVAGPFYNFTVPEPMGVVGIVAPEWPSLLGLVSRLAPAMVGGNAAVVLASQQNPLPAVTLSEVLATSDVPAGAVNVLTGWKEELVPVLASHMDVNALDCAGIDPGGLAQVEAAAAENLKRIRRPIGAGDDEDWLSQKAQSLLMIADFLEFKTVWHPIGT
jgi:acyl-CoA reductase-like NAD-dependent aldehyde dehydrogenase